MYKKIVFKCLEGILVLNFTDTQEKGIILGFVNCLQIIRGYEMYSSTAFLLITIRGNLE